ncbi:response regulator transcription factor [Salinithrix halophila]|uniref:Response regulator transcription factor n=1 Tax=Salinithrix halophila TaxID=1485204 RepID=A0ABV8JKW6_9BACL
MEKILLVEDDQTLALGIQYTLEDEDMKVEVAHSVEEGYQLHQEKSFDLILLDISLPDGNGYDLCKKIRETDETPIIFLTANDDEVNIVRGLDLGADDYITKPFRVKELVSRIKATIRRNRMVNQNKKMHFRDLVIDFANHKVLKNGKDVFLTPIEYKLLVTLAKNRQQVLTRHQILDKIWDSSGEFIDNNTLSVHIRRLRGKIEDDPTNPVYILTIRGVGYKFGTI